MSMLTHDMLKIAGVLVILITTDCELNEYKTLIWKYEKLEVKIVFDQETF